jgi:hypothetical protein
MLIRRSLAGGMWFAVRFAGLNTANSPEEGNAMKNFLAAVTLLVLLVMESRDVQAQVYAPYYDPYWDFQYQQYHNYLQWQQYLQYLQQYDPYYDLHVMHYQLYLQPYQPYQIYQPCCYSLGGTIPAWSRPFVPTLIPRSKGTVGSLRGRLPGPPRATIRR